MSFHLLSKYIRIKSISIFHRRNLPFPDIKLAAYAPPIKSLIQISKIPNYTKLMCIHPGPTSQNNISTIEAILLSKAINRNSIYQNNYYFYDFSFFSRYDMFLAVYREPPKEFIVTRIASELISLIRFSLNRI